MTIRVTGVPGNRVPPVPTGGFERQSGDIGDLEILGTIVASGPPGEAIAGPEEGLAEVIRNLVCQNVRNTPRFLVRNGPWVAVLAVMWVWLHSISAITFLRFPSAIRSLLSAAIFLTATYNSFLGKMFYTPCSACQVTMFRIFRKLNIAGIRQ